MTRYVPARALRPGDVILPPRHERGWMARTCAERGLPDMAMLLTVASVREGWPDSGGSWLLIDADHTADWLAGRPARLFTFKVRPLTPWPTVTGAVLAPQGGVTTT